MDALDTLTDILLTRLVWTSAQAVLLIAVVWLISRRLPQLSASLRCMLWWLVGMQLIIGLCWSSPVELPLLAPVAPSSVSVDPIHVTEPLEVGGPANHAMSSVTTAPAETGWIRRWPQALLALWLAALIAQCLMAIRQWRASRRVLREARMPDETLRLECVRQARKLGLRTPPALRLSCAISSPQVTGLWHPVVLLPAAQRLTQAETAMALLHEMAHLRRGDLWLGWVPAIAQRLFFFHPLVTWAMREYALHREAACDEQVLKQAGTEAQAYGQLLVRLGVTRSPHAGLGGASPTFQNLKRRLIMLQQNQNPTRRSGLAWLLIVLIALIGVLPYRVTAGSADQNGTRTSLPAPPPLPPAPPMQPPVPPAAMPPAPPAAPPAPPAPPMAGRSFSGHHVSIDTASHADEGFALFVGDSVTISGSNNDVATAKRLQKGNQPMLWLRRGDKAWVIRDKAMLERAKSIYQPVSQLAQAQGELAGKQGEIAGRQAGVAARSAGFAERQAAIAQQQAQLAAQTLDPTTRASAEMGARRHSLQTEQDTLSRQQDALRAEQDKMQSELSAKQAELSRQQAAMSQRQQQATQKADRQIRQLMDDALASGVAQPAAAR
ncbi:MAG: peptidase M56 [Pseudomonadota bacterium]|nr:peptidase M56 [Pseudomonadota bacterium]